MIQFRDPGGEPYYSLATPLAPGWWSGANNAFLANNAPAGAATTYAIQLNAGGTLYKNLSSNFASSVTGVRYYIAGSFNNGSILMQFLDITNTQVEIRTDGLGHLYATRNNVQIGTTSTQQLVANQGWTYFDAAPVIASGTSGSIVISVNNLQWLNITGVNTNNSGNNYINRVQFGNPFTATCYIKDVYILDTGTGINVSRLGDVTVGVNYITAAGVNQAWTNNGGSSQANSVADGITHTGTWPDGDATYISSSTPGQISDFAGQTLSLTGTIFSLCHAFYARKDDAGTRTMAGVVLSGSATAVGATQNLGNTYNYYFD
jgi:hypothetical protein